MSTPNETISTYLRLLFPQTLEKMGGGASFQIILILLTIPLWKWGYFIKIANF